MKNKNEQNKTKKHIPTYYLRFISSMSGCRIVNHLVYALKAGEYGVASIFGCYSCLKNTSEDYTNLYRSNVVELPFIYKKLNLFF